MQDDKYMIWLSRINGIGIKKIKILLDIFGSAKEIWNAPKDVISKVDGISDNCVEKIYSSQNRRLFFEMLKEMEKKNVKYVSILSDDYPELLKEIYDPPLVLYYKGILPDSSLKKVSMIGSRRCSEYGSRIAYKFSRELAENNVVIVSGMATGIDSMSHRGAIDGKGVTIAVLGCGVDICYPKENERLMEKIIENGCVISEYILGTSPIGTNFPMRNRIIAGLSEILVVVEAAKRSGALITVNQALENGRTIYAVPGNVTSYLSEGTNNLIKDGSFVATKTEDIFNGLGINSNKQKSYKNNQKDISILDIDEKKVYDCIGVEPMAVEEIFCKLDYDISKLQRILMMLELNGYIKQLAGSRFIKDI